MLINSITGILSVILWLFIFLPGLLINSQPFRDHVAAGESILYNLFLVRGTL